MPNSGGSTAKAMTAIWEGSASTDGGAFSENASANTIASAPVGMRMSRVERRVVATSNPAPGAADAEDQAAISPRGQIATKSRAITMAMTPRMPMYIQPGMFSPRAAILTATNPSEAMRSSQASDTSS